MSETRNISNRPTARKATCLWSKPRNLVMAVADLISTTLTSERRPMSERRGPVEVAVGGEALHGHFSVGGAALTALAARKDGQGETTRRAANFAFGRHS